MSGTSSVEVKYETHRVPNFYGIRTAGISVSAWIAGGSAGIVEVDGYDYTYTSLDDGGMLVIGKSNYSQHAYYLDIKNAQPVPVFDPELGRTVYKFKGTGVVAEFGFFKGDDVMDLEGITIGPSAHLGPVGIGYEEPIDGSEEGSGYTLTLGQGVSLPVGPDIKVGNVFGKEEDIVADSSFRPFIELPGGDIYRITNFVEPTLLELVLEHFYGNEGYGDENGMYLAPSAEAYETSNGFAFLLHNSEGLQLYIPSTQEVINLTADNLADLEAEIDILFNDRDMSYQLVDPKTFEAPLCFAAGTQIKLGNGQTKSIEDIVVGDLVLAYDEKRKMGQDALESAKVVRIFRNQAPYLLNFHGLGVTPGHVFLCGKGKYEGQHKPLIEILIADETIVDEQGVSLRASTNLPVDTFGDRFVELLCFDSPSDEEGVSAFVRAGTIVVRPDGTSWRIMDALLDAGYSVQSDGRVMRGSEMPHPVFWLGDAPKPEDYVLAMSELWNAGRAAADAKPYSMDVPLHS